MAVKSMHKNYNASKNMYLLFKKKLKWVLTYYVTKGSIWGKILTIQKFLKFS